MNIIITRVKRRLFYLLTILSIIILSLLSISNSKFIFSRKLRTAPEYEPKKIDNNNNNNENNILKYNKEILLNKDEKFEYVDPEVKNNTDYNNDHNQLEYDNINNQEILLNQDENFEYIDIEVKNITESSNNQKILQSKDENFENVNPEVKKATINILLNNIKKPLKVEEFIELKEREELHTALWNSIFGEIDISTNDNNTLYEYKKKLIENSKFLNGKDLDGLTESKKLLVTIHQSLYPWLYGYHYKSFTDLIQSYKGRGIVVCTGDYHFKYTRSTIDILRNIINCTLPIEVFYNGYNDLSRENQDILRKFDNVYVNDISKYYNNDIVNATGWAIKPYAILASRFEEVILIDADVIYIRDPVELFEEKGYLDRGTLFFRDRSLLLGENNGTRWLKQWMSDPLPETKELRFWKEESYHEMESSTVVMHKTKTLLGLLNTCKLNEYRYRQDVVYKMVYGDKETFWMGFDMARQHYYMSPDPCAFVGEIIESYKKKEKIICGHNGHLLRNGKLMFWNGHLVKDKNKNGANMKLINIDGYYLDHGNENWSPGLDCIYITKTSNETIRFNEEEKNIINRIFNRENQVHYLVPH